MESQGGSPQRLSLTLTSAVTVSVTAALSQARIMYRLLFSLFVPMNDTCEINQVKLTNNSSSVKTLSLFSYVEWCLWNADDDMKNFQRNFSTGEVEIVDSTIFHKNRVQRAS